MSFNKNLFILTAVFVSCVVLAFPAGIHAQPAPPPTGFAAWAATLPELVTKLRMLVIAIGVIASVIILPYIVILFNTGSVENIKKAQGWLGNLIGGLILLVLSYMIVYLVGNSIFGLGI